MRFIRILPDTWARTLWPLSITTRNIALGNGSTTLPSTSIPSSLLIAFRLAFHQRRGRRVRASLTRGQEGATLDSVPRIAYPSRPIALREVCDALRAPSLRCRRQQAARPPRPVRLLHRAQVEGIRLPPDRLLYAHLR